MHYFSYGSNMPLRRLQRRVPSAAIVTVAILPHYVLRFHKASKDGSGKCDAEYTGRSADQVIGVVFDLSEDEKPYFDKSEGLGKGYDEKIIDVLTPTGESLSPTMYFATNIDSSLKPHCWYKKQVIVGARENDLPSEYVSHIECIETIDDPDKARCESELAIYG